MSRKLVVWEDLWCACVLEPMASNAHPPGVFYAVTLAIVPIMGQACPINGPAIFGTMQRQMSEAELLAVASLDDLPATWSGYVKWDGCSDWHLVDSPVHGCSPEAVREIGDSLSRAYRAAAKMLLGPGGRGDPGALMEEVSRG